MKPNSKQITLSLLIATLWSAPLMAEGELDVPATSVKQAVQKAINTNPEVNAAWFEFNAAADEERVAGGKFLPTVDLTASTGKQDIDQKGGSVDYTRRTVGISVSQTLFDGFAIENEVLSLNHTRLAKYYDLVQTSSAIALEAVASYEDVLKYRELVGLATENFAQHKRLYEAIIQKAQAGVARGVDLELAVGRLALAESNLLTEVTSLHDVSAKYLNVVGELPANELDVDELSMLELPASVQEALKLAYEASPRFNAAIEQVLSATADFEGRNAAFMPKVELKASHNRGDNVSGIEGRHSDQILEIVATYNLFKGGSDVAAQDQFRNRLQFARQNRDKVCTNLRQDLTVAYHDILQLTEKVGYLNQHQLSTSKAREAYKAQFDIGQRTLLDLLDTENEYFQAKRNYVIAQHDLVVAQARSLHETGKLLTSLGAQRADLPSAQELRQNRDFAQNVELACPPVAVQPIVIDKMAFGSSYAPAQSQVGNAALVCTDVKSQVNQWANAWSNGNVAGYLANYSASFSVPGMSHAQWKKLRTDRVGKAKNIAVSVENLRTNEMGSRVEASFTQLYRNDSYTDRVEKVLVFDNVNGQCRIVEENVKQGRLY